MQTLSKVAVLFSKRGHVYGLRLRIDKRSACDTDYRTSTLLVKMAFVAIATFSRLWGIEPARQTRNCDGSQAFDEKWPLRAVKGHTVSFIQSVPISFHLRFAMLEKGLDLLAGPATCGQR